MKTAVELFNQSSQPLKVTLSSVGNPDYNQNPHKPMVGCEPDTTLEIESFTEASVVCRKFITDNNLGGGNWSGGQIFLNDMQIAQVSYNGKVWDISKDKVNYWKDSGNIIMGLNLTKGK